MEKYEINVPLLVWLVGGSRIGGSYNIYCASVGTDPQKGMMKEKIFNYRIWIEKTEDETEYFKVCCYYGFLSFDNQNKDELVIETFPMLEESREEMKKYIEKMAEEYLKN